uniref:Lipid-binding serum glycoprotein N-terminal domain-containing protein n=1 Tax=Heliothis virescens TaxID=7102 RepID=A0A2A4JEE6_HELVI
MRTLIFFGFLVADISAIWIPGNIANTIDTTDERSINNSIEQAIEGVSLTIREAGLDPLYIDERRISKALPVPVIFNSEAFVEEVLITGLSNIAVHKINFSLLTSRLYFDIELPYIVTSVGAASIKTTLFGNTLDVKASGKVEIKNVRVAGQVSVRIGILSGITIRRVRVKFSLGGIHSNVKLVIQGKNYSCKVNRFIGSGIPNTIKAFNPEINELLEIILMDILTEKLSRL